MSGQSVTEYYREKFSKTWGGKLMFQLLEKYIVLVDESGIPFDIGVLVVEECMDTTPPDKQKLFGKRIVRRLAELSELEGNDNEQR